MDEIHSIQLETTSRCNLACVTCLKPAYPGVWQERDMDERLFNHILTQLPTKSAIHLQGWGEPLLHPDTLSHVRKLKAAGAIASFTTNGTIMDEALADSLIDSGLDGLTFSMAGNSQATQDWLRGSGSFASLKNSIRILVAAKKKHGKSLPQVAVSYLLTPETVGELPGVVCWCRKMGVDGFVTVHLTQAGCPEQQKLQLMLSKHEARSYRLLCVRTQLSAIFSKMRLDLKEFHPTLTPVCDKNPLNSVFINAKGEVSPCVFLCPPVKQEITWHDKGDSIRQKPLVFGNVQVASLADIWQLPKYRRFREKFRARKEYHDRKLGGVSYSMAGSTELDAAVKRITEYLSAHPAPGPCAACAKLDGF